MSKTYSHWFPRGLLAAAALCSLLTTVTASAAIIGSFDPAFGPGIPNLGFRGTITLDVSGCGPGFHENDGDPCSITVDPLGVQINFYNATLNTPNNILTTVNLPGSFFPNFILDGTFDANGNLEGFDTNDSALFAVSVTDTTPGATISYSGQMLLFFTDPFLIDPAFLVNCPNADGPTACGANSQTSNPAVVTFSTIPEPGSVTLAALGLGALVASRRRRAPIAR
jgi:hypothetical protein